VFTVTLIHSQLHPYIALAIPLYLLVQWIYLHFCCLDYTASSGVSCFLVFLWTHTHTEYEKTTKSTIATRLKKEGIAKWQRRWERTDKGALCRSFLLYVEQRLRSNLPISPAFTAIVSGHGKTKSYLHRFGIIDSQTCPCKDGDQTPEHLIHHCNILETQRDVMKRTI
jgi:hypothetical protein